MGLDSPTGTKTDAPQPKPKAWHPTQEVATGSHDSTSTAGKDKTQNSNSSDPGRNTAEALLGPSTDWTKRKPDEPGYLDFSVDPNKNANNPANNPADNPDNPTNPKFQKRNGDQAAQAAALGGQPAQEAKAEDGAANNLIRGMAAALGKAADFSWMKPASGNPNQESNDKPQTHPDKPQAPAGDGSRRGAGSDGTRTDATRPEANRPDATDASQEKPVDPATKARNDHAKAGKDHADTQEKRYINRHNGKGDKERYEPGEHKNQDGSSYTVGADGRVSSFTTAKTKDNPNGLTYSNIKYDEQGVKSYDSPWGQKFSRISDANANGYAHWKSTTQDGRPVTYQGSNSSQWVGKPSFSDEGFSNIIGSGPNNGMMFGRAMDGSHITTRQLRGGSIQTDTVLPDNTQVTRTSKVENGNLTSDDSKIRVKDSAGDIATVDLGNKGSNPNEQGTGKPGEKDAGRDQKDAQKERNAQKERDAQKEKDKQKEEAEKAKLAKEASEKLALFKNLMNPENLKKLDKIQDLQVKTTPGNDHAVGISLSLSQPMDMKAPHISVPNPNGPGYGVPMDSSIQNVAMVVSSNPKDGDRIDVTQMRNFPSDVAAHGPLGRRRPARDKHGFTESMSFNDNHLTVKSTNSERAVSIPGHAFDAGPTSALVNDANLRKSVKEGVEAVAKNVDDLKIHKNAPGDFNITVDPKQTDIPLNMKLEGKFAGLFGAEATKLQLKDGPIEMHLNTNSANGSPELSFKEGDVKVGVKGLGIETSLSVQKISQGRDANGKPVALVQFYNSEKPFEIPIGK